LVRLIEPHTEAGPEALLIQTLVLLGNTFGPGPHCRVGGTRHAGNLFAVLVGESSKARKGTALSAVKYALQAVDPSLSDPDRVIGGLSSGEGLIFAVRDPIRRGDVIEDPGVLDKRRVIQESEFAKVLRNGAREGNTLSVTLRQAWDGETMATLTKSSPMRATDAHLSIAGHITVIEVRKELTSTDSANGLANRFLWVCTRRSKLLPEGGELPGVDFSGVGKLLTDAITFARTVATVERDQPTKAIWAREYPHLSEGRPGLFGATTSRAEAQVLRLSLIYALADRSYVVRPIHLAAALEVWRYCRASARFIFGDSLGDPIADDLDLALQEVGAEGLTRTDIRNHFGRNRSMKDIQRGLNLLSEHGRAVMQVEPGKTRPVERWFTANSSSYDINDISLKERSTELPATTYDQSLSVPDPSATTCEGRPYERI
jgi:hypothetical protein